MELMKILKGAPNTLVRPSVWVEGLRSRRLYNSPGA